MELRAHAGYATYFSTPLDRLEIVSQRRSCSDNEDDSNWTRPIIFAQGHLMVE